MGQAPKKSTDICVAGAQWSEMCQEPDHELGQLQEAQAPGIERGTRQGTVGACMICTTPPFTVVESRVLRHSS